MQQYDIVNDVHLGALRKTGTTPQSARALQEYLFTSFASHLAACKNDLIILGDLYDGGSCWEWVIPVVDLLKDYPKRVFLVPGNHDIRQGSYTAFELLGEILLSWRSDVFYLDTPSTIDGDLYVIPHLSNQAAFDQALEDAPRDRVLLVHANIDNKFAAEKIHSLNMTAEQCAQFKMVVAAHEHGFRRLGAAFGNTICLGNQWPSSIADCLTGDKFASTLNIEEGHCVVHHSITWDREDFAQIEVQAAADFVTAPRPFVEYKGIVGHSELNGIVSLVRKERQNSGAYIIKNSVTTPPLLMDEAGAALEITKSYSVLDLLFSFLTEDHANKIKTLLGERNAEKPSLEMC